MNKADIQAIRIYLSENPKELSIGFLSILVDVLTACLSASADELDDIEGELLFVLTQLDTIDSLSTEIKNLVSELKLRLVRLNKRVSRFIRGKDNTDILKDKRDSDGYITDLTLLRPPYETKRIIHRDGGPTEFTEEIYIDCLGRYFRKIYNVVEINTKSESAIADNILSEFECTTDKQE